MGARNVAEILTMQDLANGHLDVKALGEAANGDENTIVTTRTGNTYPSAKKAINTMFQNGGLPAKPFPTLAKMQTEGTSLADGQLAQVYNEAANNGLYVKTAGAWIKSAYDPVEQAKDYADRNALFNPVLIATEINLNTLNKSGVYVSTTSTLAKTSLNYPIEGGTGTLRVIGASGSSFINQEYQTIGGGIFNRFFNGTSWNDWKNKGREYALLTETTPYKAPPTATDNLNDYKTKGIYLVSSAFTNWQALNYPVKTTGFLEVFQYDISSLIIQRYTTKDNIYIRRSAGGVWEGWETIANLSYYVQSVLGTQDLNDLKILGVYLKNNGTTGTPELNYPTRDIGVLKVYKGSMTSVIIQEFVSTKGSIYVRRFDSVVWSEWVANNPSIASSGGSDSIAYKKVVKGLDFYSKMVNGNNSIKFGMLRRTRSSINQDVWGVSSCEEVNAAGSVVKPITSEGVWETAITAAENVGDHSGGAHGDEMLQSAYFMVDGVHYPQDFIGEGAAKEIKFYQKSTIFIEAKTDVLCYKEIVWTFNNKGLNLKQKLTFPTAKVLTTSWIAMLPILRKTNQNNTGDRVTDTEVRSQDGIVIDASEPNFERRSLDVKDGDSISLSSSVSGIGAELIINTIKASNNPQCFVQNTDPYNKIYIQGAAIGTPYTTTINEEWYVDVDFKVTTSN